MLSLDVQHLASWSSPTFPQAGLKSLGQQRVAALAALRLICGARRTGRAGRQALEDAATIHRLAAETQAAWAEVSLEHPVAHC